MLVRSANTDDLTLVADHYGKGDTPWDPFGDPLKLQGIPLEGFIIAEVDGEYAGFLYWFEGEKPWFDAEVGRYAYIEEVHVLPKYRGQGVGKKLLEGAIDRLEVLPLDAVYIGTTEENSVARHLYESAGFEPFHRTLLYKLLRVSGHKGMSLVHQRNRNKGQR